MNVIDRKVRDFGERILSPILLTQNNWLKKINPNIISFFGFIVGLCCVISVFLEYYWMALVLWLSNRFIDTLDGIIARITNQQSDLGGYLDILFDFFIYSFIILGFIYTNITNQLVVIAGAILLCSYYINAISWAYLSALLEKRKKTKQEKTSINMPSTIVGGTVTVIVYSVFFCLPKHIMLLFWVFVVLIFIGIIQRIFFAFRVLKN